MTLNSKPVRKNGRPFNTGWDYDAIHYMLWRDRLFGVEAHVNINEWAAIYGVSKVAIFKVLDRMVDDGRISRTDTRGVYHVHKPVIPWNKPDT